ncbi:hypothetical protein HMPREF3145_00915 [Corynebacterium sp. HMSC05C01]|uniref:hypothetical protein n=1 Tax=Corynebacterium sp. HMSC05C01 TaxID=1581113 RepID=UPI0008A6554A|nr:hypothetical protein [Corynebacterium sp. HMSC05C01]OFT72732.1 hypothetical protein HMPREF3145_00915 [Corynebacterium sp. HMSC05C01]
MSTINFSQFDSAEELLNQFNALFDAKQSDDLILDLDNVSAAFRSTAIEIASAAGIPCNTAPKRPIRFETGDTLVLSETIFADTETDPSALNRLEQAHFRSLASLSALQPAANCVHIHVVYCSIDKAAQYISIARRVNTLNELQDTTEFILIPYAHPKNGYPAPPNGHIDAKILPNKSVAKNFAKLHSRFYRSLNDFSEGGPGLYVRVGLDDDDLWAKWALRVISGVARQAVNLPGRTLKAVGLPNSFVYYPTGNGELHEAELDVALTGTKFLVSRDLGEIEKVSPYELPEFFTANVRRAFRGREIDLFVERNTPAFFVYMRSGSNLSSMRKQQHYLDEPKLTACVGNADTVLDEINRNHEPASVAGQADFTIDPPSLRASARLDHATNNLAIQGNFEEYLVSRGMEYPGAYSLVINYGIDGKRSEVAIPLSERLVVDAAGWTERVIVRIEDPTNENVGSSWLRGSEPFLS